MSPSIDINRRAISEAHTLIGLLWHDWKADNPTDLTDTVAAYLLESALRMNASRLRGHKLVRYAQLDAKLIYRFLLKSPAHDLNHKLYIRFQIGRSLLMILATGNHEMGLFAAWDSVLVTHVLESNYGRSSTGTRADVRHRLSVCLPSLNLN